MESNNDAVVESNKKMDNYNNEKNNMSNDINQKDDNIIIENNNQLNENTIKKDKKKSKNAHLRKRIRRRNKKINKLIKESEAIEKSYKPGIFEEVINGPRGPDVRLHRHNLIVGLLKLFLILFITAGIVLLTVIMLCITINVGYVCVQIDDVNSIVQMLFFAFYFNALYFIVRSLWRTYLRAIHTILDARFGSSINDIFIKRVLGYFFSMRIASWTMPEKYESHPKDWYEKVNLIIFVIFLFIIFLPILLIAIFYGYWRVTSTVCLLFVCGGSVCIVILNVFSRFILYIKFFRRLDEYYYNAPFFINVKERISRQTSYLRLTYCTTNGLDGGENPINYVLDLLIHMVFVIGVASFVFGSFDPEVWKITLIGVLLLILVPIRCRKSIIKFLAKCHIFSKAKLEMKDEINKNKINDQMNAAYQQYLDNKKVSQEAQQKKIESQKQNQNQEKSFWNVIKGKAIINNDNAADDDNNQANFENNHVIDICSPEYNKLNDSNATLQESIPSTPLSNKFSLSSNSNKYSPLSPTSIKNSPLSQNSNINSSKSKTSASQYLSPNSKDDDDEESFYYLLKSDKSYIRHKALLTWDINTITSWKGCLTIFISRFVKYCVGVTFMAFLNYYRYSASSDVATTNNYLVVDIITHFVFLILLLGQDILYLFPVNTSFLSMKTRKFIFIIFITLELILVIGMRAIIPNGYIPMAFIVLAYANFTVYPDPRYSWDDERIQRKTFFDLFKPEINLRSEVSYKHFGKTKGFIFKKSGLNLFNKLRKSSGQKESNKNNLYLSSTSNKQEQDTPSTSNKKNQKQEQEQKQRPLIVLNDDNLIVDNNNINESETANENKSISISLDSNSQTKYKGKHVVEELNSPSITNSGYSHEGEHEWVDETVSFDGLNDEALYCEPINKSEFKNKNNNLRNIYVDVSTGNKYHIKNEYDPKEEMVKVVNNIRTEMQYKRNTRARHNSSSILVVTLIIIILSLFIGIMFAQSPEENNSSNRDLNLRPHQKPAICQWRGDGISINEFAALSCACYYTTLDDIKYSWLYGRPKSSTNDFVVGDNNINSPGVQYVDFVNKDKNLIVVAVRGTSTIEDIFQDIYIWSASALLQLSGFFGTFIKFWPRDTIASLVNFIVTQFTNLQLLYWVDVENHIKNLMTSTNSTIYITGHSLGGGVAGVISAHLNLPAITFSSPGLGYSYKTYGIELENLINNFVNIVPMSDPVPLLDSQVGQIQNIECKTKEPLSCHSIFNTMDTLNKMCSENSAYRYWDNTVEQKYEGKELPYIIN